MSVLICWITFLSMPVLCHCSVRAWGTEVLLVEIDMRVNERSSRGVMMKQLSAQMSYHGLSHCRVCTVQLARRLLVHNLFHFKFCIWFCVRICTHKCKWSRRPEALDHMELESCLMWVWEINFRPSGRAVYMLLLSHFTSPNDLSLIPRINVKTKEKKKEMWHTCNLNTREAETGRS